MRRLLLAMLAVCFLGAAAPGTPDYSKRVQVVEQAVIARVIGKWTNSVDGLVIEIHSIDATSGRIEGVLSPTTGPAAANVHELVGWISGAPKKDAYDNVIPVTFSTTLYEYGTLPIWAGYLRGETLVTMHYLVWPNRPYPWDHISAFQETWTKVP